MNLTLCLHGTTISLPKKFTKSLDKERNLIIRMALVVVVVVVVADDIVLRQGR